MRLLLDTNVFIWLNDSPQRIGEQVMSIVANPDNDLFLSLTSIWEMQIKIQLGKLQSGGTGKRSATANVRKTYRR